MFWGGKLMLWIKVLTKKAPLLIWDGERLMDIRGDFT